MRRRTVALVAALAVGFVGLGACKGDGTVSTFDRESADGAQDADAGGTPITLADGTFVTLPDGTKVTAPVGAKRGSTTTFEGVDETGGDDDGAPTVPTIRSAPGTTSPAYLLTTGTTARAAQPGDRLAFPRLGVYRFRDIVRPDDGSNGADKDTHFLYSSDTPTVVRVRESNAAGTEGTQAYYEQRYGNDGLWLTASQLPDGVCSWEPNAALLPERVIDGGEVVTKSSCPSGDRTLSLETRVKFKLLRDVTIDGRAYRCIDVTRYRVLSDGATTIISDAVDTYSFELGIRVAVSEHSTTRTGSSQTGFVRSLVLQTPPS